MTDKLKLFKVRLASGAERYIVAPDLIAVAQLQFERSASGSIDAGVDPVRSVEEDLDVDFVILREPVPESKPDERIVPRAEQPCGDHAVELVGTDCVRCGWRIEQSEWTATPQPLGVGSPCPQCGGILHATLGQLTCSLGHQAGDAPRDIAGDANQKLSDIENPQTEP